MTRYNYRDNIVLVTGSSSGIGAATAILFAKCGAQLVITGTNDIKLNKVARQCAQISPCNRKPFVIVADISKRDDMKRIVNLTISAFNKINILINNVGVGPYALINEHDYIDKFSVNMAINLFSTTFMTTSWLEYLAATKGIIINISSVSACRSVGRL